MEAFRNNYEMIISCCLALFSIWREEIDDDDEKLAVVVCIFSSFLLIPKAKCPSKNDLHLFSRHFEGDKGGGPS